MRNLILTLGLILIGMRCSTTIPKEMLDRARNSNLPIIIGKPWVSLPNSAGGVDIAIYYENISKKKIKYVIFYPQVFNGVDDPVNCTIRDYSVGILKDTGPIDPNQRGGGRWENTWYNYSAKYSKLTKVTVIFMDGSQQLIEGKDLDSIILNP
jgi:hypothetical protein